MKDGECSEEKEEFLKDRPSAGIEPKAGFPGNIISKNIFEELHFT